MYTVLLIKELLYICIVHLWTNGWEPCYVLPNKLWQMYNWEESGFLIAGKYFEPIKHLWKKHYCFMCAWHNVMWLDCEYCRVVKHICLYFLKKTFMIIILCVHIHLMIQPSILIIIIRNAVENHIMNK